LNGEARDVEILGTVSVSESDTSVFLVHTESGVQEFFIDAEGRLTDGNQLNSVEIVLESPREELIRTRFALAEGGLNSGNASSLLSIKAPMPGLVRSIVVAVGDEVEKNATLLVLEAMKMENNITSSIRGRVVTVHTTAGSTVDKNAKLLDIERLP
jgi:biotin carboxyl carrier protein